MGFLAVPKVRRRGRRNMRQNTSRRQKSEKRQSISTSRRQKSEKRQNTSTLAIGGADHQFHLREMHAHQVELSAFREPLYLVPTRCRSSACNPHFRSWPVPRTSSRAVEERMWCYYMHGRITCTGHPVPEEMGRKQQVVSSKWSRTRTSQRIKNCEILEGNQTGRTQSWAIGCPN